MPGDGVDIIFPSISSANLGAGLVNKLPGNVIGTQMPADSLGAMETIFILKFAVELALLGTCRSPLLTVI